MTRTSAEQIKDHFSGHAALYANTRPDYPAGLFRLLAEMAPGTNRAWDCATGNGQAALSLLDHFDTVCATDASEQQVRQAGRSDGIHYHVATAEASAIASGSIDLVVVAQALHWFDIEPFTNEVRRVLKTEGVLAAWCYTGVRISPAVDKLVSSFYQDTVGPYWPPERKHVESGYRTLELPLVEQEMPTFSIEKEWDLSRFVQYLKSWSATQRYMRDRGRDPVKEFVADLSEVWGSVTTKRRVRWPLVVRAGRLV